MKIDVEGVEKELIEGGYETLKNHVDNLFGRDLVDAQGPLFGQLRRGTFAYQ